MHATLRSSLARQHGWSSLSRHAPCLFGCARAPSAAIRDRQRWRASSTASRDDTPPSTYGHVPVLLSEVLTRLAPHPGGYYCDATFGAGGYTRAILGNLQARTSASIYSLCLIRCAVKIDDPSRGFSYRWDGPLDMRMSAEGTTTTDTAADLVNSLAIPELERLFFRLGGEQHARRIARAIGVARAHTPILRTEQLATLVLDTVRGQINDELGELKRGLLAAEQLLRPGGHLLVVTFHSLEDRLVKDFIYRCVGRRPAEGKTHERAQRKQRRLRKEQQHPVDPEAEVASKEDMRHTTTMSFEIVERKAIRPTIEEIEANPRCQSAKLRHAIRTHAPPMQPTC
ncbi:S-adenosyl-L-methionine-dependent methyltransferase [Syncephalis pseudoplumigaleata]|uniref:S-adenosyl-L-methionine-dependent methyltransferase n=1 Tax=Syncephalis pseudoplumigaleata TaxID=1712513 RepID=A0A4P9YTV5_9FUNG|nr:S-adenosyl-L-methionine-dependent methyltransferase [Syncephalis pseudoplumigaleata]|eukprot:RKP23433.1 S-adenosyl-L-methionine-dependent methyltransferase [Syncephalis pseudoplumigaleata]